MSSLPLLGGATDPADEVQEGVARWAAIREETVRLESDWQWQRSLMHSTVDALKVRLAKLEAKRDEVLAKTASEREETAGLVDASQAMSKTVAGAKGYLVEVDADLARIRPQLPPRLSAALDLPFQSIADAELPLGERMQHTMTILNRCQLFDQSVACGEELIELPSGQRTLMEVVYWGLAQGYALDRVGGVAYLGGPGEMGWAWVARPEAASAVTKLLALAKDQAEPELVLIDVRLKHSTEPGPKEAHP